MRYFIIVILSSILFLGCAKNVHIPQNCSGRFENTNQDIDIQKSNNIEKSEKSVSNPVEKIQDVTIFFDYDSYILKAIEKDKLNALAKDLKNTSYKLKIDGYCDERGTNAYNLSLGQLRANTVQKYLVEYGLQNQIQTLSYGEERPFCYEKNEDCYKINRVVKIQLTK